MRVGVHGAADEILVFEVHVVFLFNQLDHLIELIHVELADEGGEVAVPEELRQHLLLHPLRLLYYDLGVAVPP